MHRAFGTIVLAVGSLFCLFTSSRSGFAPREFAAQLGLAISTPDGYNEIRAQYGGVFLVAGGVCIAALAGRVSRTQAFTVLAVLFGGLISGRLVSLALDRGSAGYGRTIRALYAIDSIGLISALVAMWLERRGS